MSAGGALALTWNGSLALMPTTSLAATHRHHREMTRTGPPAYPSTVHTTKILQGHSNLHQHTLINATATHETQAIHNNADGKHETSGARHTTITTQISPAALADLVINLLGHPVSLGHDHTHNGSAAPRGARLDGGLIVTVCFMTAPMPSHGPLPATEVQKQVGAVATVVEAI